MEKIVDFALNLRGGWFRIPPMEIKYKIWLEKDGKVLFGRGRDDILTAIQEAHSLNAAAKKLQMSYRAAWGRLKASEERMGMKLVEIDATEKGMHLTARAQAIIDRFERLERDVEALLAEANREFKSLIEPKKK
ncbi:MAG: LysR family transcriptional regulator [Syntrophales bacterium]|nr:LysR family transcriptional regulator [Syntrophales bacterium]MDD4340576.1 LysR family transcriptional regulator [Syntrophales bacterium]HOG08376.1 LysR family transcriptional regulator [Syntrophales bacterium]HOS78161.1 LysR family transcriptional regulator [Syntrophales bacterium]